MLRNCQCHKTGRDWPRLKFDSVSYKSSISPAVLPPGISKTFIQSQATILGAAGKSEKFRKQERKGVFPNFLFFFQQKMFRIDLVLFLSNFLSGIWNSIPYKQTHWNTLPPCHFFLNKNELPVQVRCMRQGAQGWCTGMTQRDGMGREVGGVSGWGTHIHPWRIQVNVWQNQYNIVK